MNIKKLILGGAALVTTATALFADGNRNTRKQLFTASTGVCVVAPCFTVATPGSGNGCVAGRQYFTQDLGTQCAHPYNGIRTSTP